MSIVRLVVLGTLDQLGQASGYDITQFLARKMIDRWTDIKPASIYHALRQLEKEGAIRALMQTRNGLYPEKTLYTPTDAGRELQDRLQEQAFLGLFPLYLGFKVALKFNTRRSPDEIRQLAERAVARIDGQLAAMDAYLATLEYASPQYEYDAFFIDHDRQLLLAERSWIQEAVRRGPGVVVAPELLAETEQDTPSGRKGHRESG